MPFYRWLSRNWLRGWIEEAAPYIYVLDSHRKHPLVAQMYDVDHILRLWRDRQRRLASLENLPQTLCHLDAPTEATWFARHEVIKAVDASSHKQRSRAARMLRRLPLSWDLRRAVP